MNIKFVNYSHVKVEADDSTIYSLRDYFAFDAPGYRFNPKFKYGMWDGKIRLMGFDGLLPYGLYPFLIRWAEANEMEYTIDKEIYVKEDLEKESRQWIKDTPVYSGADEISPYWYQEDSVVYALDNKRCILNLPTSAGKSLIQGLISKWYVQRHNQKVLLLVPTVGLTTQMRNDYKNYRLFTDSDLQLIGDGKRSTDISNTKILEVTLGDYKIKLFPTDRVKLKSGEFVEVKDIKVGIELDEEWVKERAV